MIGMIKKDLFMIKNNYKSIAVVMIIFIFYSIQFDMDMSFFIPFMGLMSCISTINYDDFNNWHTYASSLPTGKSGVVKSKYITSISVTILLSILTIAINFVISNFKGNIMSNELLSTVVGELFALVFMMSVLFPILLKFGAEKGRIVMFAIGFAIVSLVMLTTKVFKLKISESFISFLDSYFPIIFIVSAILMITISYCISKKIYLKKDF